MKLYALVIPVSAFLVACASPSVAPRFQEPSTAPIARSNQRAVSGIKAAKKEIRVIEVSNPALKLQLEDVSNRLDQALSELGGQSVDIIKLQSELKAETAKGNKLADDYDRQNKELLAAQKIVKQDKQWFGVGRIVYGFVDLARHLLILAAVIAVLVLALWILSFFFPIFGIALGVITSFIGRIFTRKPPG